MLLTTKAILRDIWDILMERVPRQIDIDKLQQGMLAVRHCDCCLCQLAAVSCHMLTLMMSPHMCDFLGIKTRDACSNILWQQPVAVAAAGCVASDLICTIYICPLLKCDSLMYCISSAVTLCLVFWSSVCMPCLPMQPQSVDKHVTIPA